MGGGGRGSAADLRQSRVIKISEQKGFFFKKTKQKKQQEINWVFFTFLKDFCTDYHRVRIFFTRVPDVWPLRGQRVKQGTLNKLYGNLRHGKTTATTRSSFNKHDYHY